MEQVRKAPDQGSSIHKMKLTKSKLRKIIREEIRLMEFSEDPKRGLGSDYNMFAKAAKKFPRTKVMSIVNKKTLKNPNFKNLTPEEAEEFVRLANVKFHSTFTKHDLMSYFMKLSKSR